MDSSTSRRMKQVIDPLHVMIYFVPEAQEEYAALGLEGRAEGYFPARAAALGQVPWQVVQATFFGFSPLAVQFGMTQAWSKTTPEAVTEARLRGAERALRRMVGDLLDDAASIDEALALLRRASAACSLAGRPLTAAQAALSEPADPVRALWHHLAVLREYRGDGHIGALVAAGIGPVHALVLEAGHKGGGTAGFLQASRAWGEEPWARALTELAARGLVTADGLLTDDGAALRDALEAQTDDVSLEPWLALGEADTDRLHALLTPLAQAALAAGDLPVAAQPRT